MAGVVDDALNKVHARYATLAAGEVATYIPQLALADPSRFGIAVVSMDGHRYEAGDAATEFTLQSISKPFVYALALAELGAGAVARWVGAEPSGDAFNAISLQPGTGRPANPMINAGAIVATALIPGGPQERFDRILDHLSACAGRRLEVDEAVYASELETGDRNYALAYLMRGFGALPGGGNLDAVDAYFRQCAIQVTTRDLAMMAATLANGGVNPATGTAVLPEPVTVQTLSVMATCGMYDGAGDWLVRVGLPAKSGVSGGVLAVSPARVGIAAYSPPLDPVGNSVRAIAALEELSRTYALHMLHNPAPVAPQVVVEKTNDGTATATITVRGGLDFTTAERLLHAIQETDAGVPPVVDLSAVTRVEPAAAELVRAALPGSEVPEHRDD